ncbi:MAG: ABC transporter permease [Candidatus Thorarchaeota archaeon]
MAEQEKDEPIVEETPEYEPELIPVSLQESVVRGAKGVPRGVAFWFVRRGKSIGRWIANFFRGIVNFFRNPGPRVIGAFRKLRREMDSLTWIQLIGILGVFGIFLIWPLVDVIRVSFTLESTGGFTLQHFVSLFSDSNVWPWVRDPITGNLLSFVNLTPSFYDVDNNLLVVWGWDFGSIINSIYVAIIVTILSVLIGVFLAFIVARYDFPGKSIVRTVLIFPILATPFVGAIGIKEFLGVDGFLNTLFAPLRNGANVILGGLGLPLVPVIWLRGLVAMIFVQSLSFFSLVYLNAYSSFMGIDPSLEEQAENLGAKGTRLFRSVTLPLAMPGIQAGAILTFILSIEDLGTPIVFQDHPIAKKTLAFQVFNNVATQAGALDPKGPAIGMLLLVISLLGFLAIRKYSSLRSYASGTKGGQWNPRTRRIGNKATLGVYAILIPLLFLALIPQISVIILSFAGIWRSNSLLPNEWTLENYEVLWRFPDVTTSIRLTLVYGAFATVMIVLLGASAAYIIARRDIPGKTALDLLVTSPIALPGIVIATGYFTAFYGTFVFPLSHPAFLIIMAYTVRKFPFTVRAAYAGLMSTPVILEEAAQNMGASKNRTFFNITLPLIGVSVLAGSLLSYVYSVSEVSTSLLLGSVGHQEAPMTYWTYEVLNGTGEYGGPNNAACLGVLMMGLQMAVITVTNRILGARSSAMTGI